MLLIFNYLGLTMQRFNFLLFLLLLSCDGDNRYDHLIMENNSDQRIYYYIYGNYPDTLLGDISPAQSYWLIKGANNSGFDQYGIKAHSTNKFTIMGKWEHFFANPYEKKCFFFFNADSLEKIPWDTIKTKYLILKRIELSYHDIDSMARTITYPTKSK
jgi:hypothetical protein